MRDRLAEPERSGENMANERMKQRAIRLAALAILCAGFASTAARAQEDERAAEQSEPAITSVESGSPEVAGSDDDQQQSDPDTLRAEAERARSAAADVRATERWMQGMADEGHSDANSAKGWAVGEVASGVIDGPMAAASTLPGPVGDVAKAYGITRSVEDAYIDGQTDPDRQALDGMRAAGE